DEPGCGNIITFAQFLFIAIEGFINQSNFGRKKSVIPISEYLILVVMFFIVNVVNNVAFAFRISMPLHIIFRSGGLIANMIMAILILRRQYSVQKYLSVIMITLGTVVCTFASAETSEGGEEADQNFITWLMGIGLLTFALFMSARMGIYQEGLYGRHGKHPKEALFYIHLLSLPGFLLTAPNIWSHAVKFSASSPLPALAAVPVIANVPRLWLYLAGNFLTQYICIGSVFILTSECTSLTVTLVLTLRKFMSLVFSIIYFLNPFTSNHWIGTFMVFFGTMLFTDVFGQIKRALDERQKKTEEKKTE
ncbi:unnamed protein product, partial [Meganyctiphanes norvegica]